MQEVKDRIVTDLEMIITSGRTEKEADVSLDFFNLLNDPPVARTSCMRNWTRPQTVG